MGNLVKILLASQCPSAKILTVSIFIYINLIGHPYEAEQKAKEKKEKRKEKETKVSEKEARKKQKSDQKLTNIHFTDFIKAKTQSG